MRLNLMGFVLGKSIADRHKLPAPDASRIGLLSGLLGESGLVMPLVVATRLAENEAAALPPPEEEKTPPAEEPPRDRPEGETHSTPRPAGAPLQPAEVEVLVGSMRSIHESLSTATTSLGDATRALEESIRTIAAPPPTRRRQS
jgi:hypothetical protein